MGKIIISKLKRTNFFFGRKNKVHFVNVKTDPRLQYLYTIVNSINLLVSKYFL
jgi:hypothetical protein